MAYMTEVPSATCPLPMSGCGYPGWGDTFAPGAGVASGSQTLEQAKAGVVAVVLVVALARGRSGPSVGATAKPPGEGSRHRL